MKYLPIALILCLVGCVSIQKGDPKHTQRCYALKLPLVMLGPCFDEPPFKWFTIP